jgi:hypothetical protein
MGNTARMSLNSCRNRGFLIIWSVHKQLNTSEPPIMPFLLHKLYWNWKCIHSIQKNLTSYALPGHYNSGTGTKTDRK